MMPASADAPIFEARQQSPDRKGGVTPPFRLTSGRTSRIPNAASRLCYNNP